MIDSRCGLLCSQLDCNKQFNVDCKGCANIDKPFWGKCEVKSCCENKKLEHCGFCSNFPCELLKSFSYEEEHGDNGERICQCQKWSNCKEIKCN